MIARTGADEECVAQAFVVDQRIGQGANRRAAERAMTVRGTLVSPMFLHLRGGHLASGCFEMIYGRSVSS
jgi:hypothetical protein